MKSPEDRPVPRPPPPPPPRRPLAPNPNAPATPIFPSASASSRMPPVGGNTDGPVVASQPTVPVASSGSAWHFAGHEILRELDRGGLGVVFLARHKMLHELRAIKRPLDQAAIDSASVVERFKREVRAVGLLRNDHVIRAHDAGIDSFGPYLVMEYLDGLPVSKLMGRLGPLPVPLACELARQAALGLHAAYERGMVHRDIKPSNLMLARHDSGARVVVIDWGLVKGIELSVTPEAAIGHAVTAHGTTMGTLGFMSPEQCRAEPSLDSRADIYSLGVTLGCLLTGRAATDWVDGIPGVVHRAGELPRIAALRTLRAELPEGLLSVIGKMVDDHASRRFAHPAAAADALGLWTSRVTPAMLFELLTAKSPTAVPSVDWALVSTFTYLPSTPPVAAGQPPVTPPSPAGPTVKRALDSTMTHGQRGATIPAAASTQATSPSAPNRPRWIGWLFALLGLLCAVPILVVVVLVAFGMFQFRKAVPEPSPFPASDPNPMAGMPTDNVGSTATGGSVPTASAFNPATPIGGNPPAWAYAEDFSEIPEGSLPKGWKGTAYAAQPDDAGKPSLVIVEPAGTPILTLPPPSASADFDLELDYRIHGHNGAGYLGQKQSQLLGLRLIQDASRSVRIELRPDGEVLAGDRFPRVVATPPPGRPATATISRRGGILRVDCMGLTATALRLPTDFRITRVELDLTAGRVQRLNSDYARIYGVRLMAPLGAGAVVAAEAAPSPQWLDERFSTTHTGDLPAGWSGPQFAVLHDTAGKPCLQVTANEGQHEIRLPALPFVTPWFVDVECALHGHDGSGYSGVRQSQRLRFLLDAVDASTVDIAMGPDGGVSIDNGPERQLNSSPALPPRLGGNRPREPLRARVEFNGEYLRVLVHGREVNRLNRDAKWPRFQSLRLSLTAGAAFRVSPEPAMIYRVVAGKLDAE